MDEWICVRLDNKNLWTADLYNKNKLIKNIGGSYPKSNQVIFDAKKTWKCNTIQIIPNGPVFEEITEID